MSQKTFRTFLGRKVVGNYDINKSNAAEQNRPVLRCIKQCLKSALLLHAKAKDCLP